MLTPVSFWETHPRVCNVQVHYLSTVYSWAAVTRLSVCKEKVIALQMNKYPR